MKKVILFLFMLSLSTLIFADNSAEFNEEMGIDTNSHNTSSMIRTVRDIPAGGLLLIPDSGEDRVMAVYPDTGNLYDANFIPSDPTNLSTPIAAALHPDGHSILVSDQLKDGLIEYDLNGVFSGWFAPAGVRILPFWIMCAAGAQKLTATYSFVMQVLLQISIV